MTHLSPLPPTRYVPFGAQQPATHRSPQWGGCRSVDPVTQGNVVKLVVLVRYQPLLRPQDERGLPVPDGVNVSTSCRLFALFS